MSCGYLKRSVEGCLCECMNTTVCPTRNHPSAVWTYSPLFQDTFFCVLTTLPPNQGSCKPSLFLVGSRSHETQRLLWGEGHRALSSANPHSLVNHLWRPGLISLQRPRGLDCPLLTFKPRLLSSPTFQPLEYEELKPDTLCLEFHRLTDRKGEF